MTANPSPAENLVENVRVESYGKTFRRCPLVANHEIHLPAYGFFSEVPVASWWMVSMSMLSLVPANPHRSAMELELELEQVVDLTYPTDLEQVLPGM